MNKLRMLALAAAMGLGLVGCAGSTGEATVANAPVEVSGEFGTEAPEGYPAIADDAFQTAFDTFHEKSLGTEAMTMTYDDIAGIFGAPGAYYVDQDYNDGEYKYYKWFSDAGRDVLITFNGDGMTYFAWTSSTITPSE